MDRDKQIPTPKTLPSSGVFFNVGAIPNMFKEREFFSRFIILRKGDKWWFWWFLFISFIGIFV
jgi:hypothetical protein